MRKAVSNPHLVEQGASAGPANNAQLKASKSDSNQSDETGFDQSNWPSQQKKLAMKRNKHKRVRSNEKVSMAAALYMQASLELCGREIVQDTREINGRFTFETIAIIIVIH